MVRYLFYTTGDLTYQSPLVQETSQTDRQLVTAEMTSVRSRDNQGGALPVE